ncbi:MAG: ATPase, T2SS/T4P/T4SS family [Lutimaribacter sp.]
MRQQGKVTVVMRAIPWEITPLESLGMPAQVGDFADLPRGLVLVTGPTGSGKSTTLAAIIDKANRTRKAHIVTIEDPIEFVHPHRMSTVNQREIGEDTHSFADALRHALRQDPDIILVGEMRDLETIATALTAAETGELSHGQRRQLEVAVALTLKPKAFLMDEPMAGLGAGGSKRLTGFLDGLRAEAPILLVEHDMDAVFALADRISVLVYGQVIATGTADEIRANPDVRRAYLGEEDAP